MVPYIPCTCLLIIIMKCFFVGSRHSSIPTLVWFVSFVGGFDGVAERGVLPRPTFCRLGVLLERSRKLSFEMSRTLCWQHVNPQLVVLAEKVQRGHSQDLAQDETMV
ncbi:unnamed protein product, partial [Ectocarpus sp. 12 AP-2014]